MKVLNLKSWAIGFFLFILLSSFASARELIPLRAGPLNMVFDADNAFLRYIKVGEHEVLRGINAPIRNQHWGTVQPQLSEIKLDQAVDHFNLSFWVTCQERDIDYRWQGVITGNKQGEITFSFDGKAHTTFKKNRIGFCVMHAPNASGQELIVQSTKGKLTKQFFPVHISPHQPAKNIRSLEHEVVPGIRARVDFSGDIFEMEDQRNWTDGSFKTYCTPLKLPYSVLVNKGDTVSQKIRLQVFGPGLKNLKPESQNLVLTPGQAIKPLAKLGLQVSSVIDTFTAKQVKQLKALNLGHLRVELDLSDSSFVKNLRKADQQAKALGVSLKIGLHPGDKADYKSLIKASQTLSSKVSHWLVVSTKENEFTAAQTHLKPVLGSALLGTAVNTDFVNLNRNRPNNREIQTIAWAINPQIHAIDNESIMETLEIQADTVHTARTFTGNLPLIAGPITLKMQAKREPLPGQLPTHVDARQTTSFTAAFTLGCVKYLSESDISSITLYETIGWKGLIESDDISYRTKNFPAKAGQVFHSYHVLRQIGEFAGGQVQELKSNHSLKVIGLLLRKSNKTRLLVANLTHLPQEVTIQGYTENSQLGHIIPINKTNAKPNPSRVIQLKPYDVITIDQTVQ